MVSDNRKVVVEDLIFIDDLEIIIYPTVCPKTSTVFVTSLRKDTKPSASEMQTDETQVLGLKDLNRIS